MHERPKTSAAVSRFKPSLVLFLLMAPASPAWASHANPMPFAPVTTRPSPAHSWTGGSGHSTCNLPSPTGWSTQGNANTLLGNSTSITVNSGVLVSGHPLNQIHSNPFGRSTWSSPTSASRNKPSGNWLGRISGRH